MDNLKEQKSIFSAIKLLWSVMTTSQKILSFPLFIALMARSLAMLMPVQCIAAIISKMQGGMVAIFGVSLPDSWSVGTVAIISFLTVFMLWLIGATAYYVLWTASGKLTNQLNSKALDWVLSPRKNTDIQLTKGELCYLIKSATDSISSFVETLFISVIPPLVSFILSIIYIGLVDWIVMLIVIGVSIILMLFAYTRVSLERKLIVNEEVYRGKINNLFLNSVTNLPFLSLFKCQIYEKNSLKKHNDGYYNNLKKRTYIQWTYWLFVMLFEYGSMAVAIIVANNHATTGMISIYSAILLLGYILNVYDPVESLGFNISNIQQGAIKINRIRLAKPNQDSLIKFSNKKSQIDKIEKIEIKDMSLNFGAFKLDNIDLTFKKGDLVVLAGSSGAGKTSIVQALLGLREYKSGKILVNDQIEIDSLFFDDDKISYALQEMQLFDRSLEENLYYPNLAKTEKSEVIIRSLGLDKLIERNMNLSESNEQKLSGGEKKRINIARAMIKTAQLYIFDEPTNELDKDNVAKVLEILKKLTDDAIVIAISHDSRLIEISNKVYYF